MLDFFFLSEEQVFGNDKYFKQITKLEKKEQEQIELVATKKLTLPKKCRK